MSSQRYQEFIAERTRLLERIKELETENAELRKRLGEAVRPVSSASNAMQNLSLQEKIDLFCSLFKGRDDVFARRWYNKTSGKAGYQPVCQNEWTPLCDKRKYKCADCPNRQFSPLTYNDYYRHLEGKDADGEMLSVFMYLTKTIRVIFFVLISTIRTASTAIRMTYRLLSKCVKVGMCHTP